MPPRAFALGLALAVPLATDAWSAATPDIDVVIQIEDEAGAKVALDSLLVLRPCLHAPGCEAAAVAPRAVESPAPSLVPLPAALGLLGAAMAALALILHRGRPSA